MRYEEIIDTETAKERFMGNYGLFTKFLFQFSDTAYMEELEEQLNGGEVGEAFETAHNMKGIAANLSLRLIEKPLYKVVEILRSGQFPDREERESLLEAWQTTIEGIKNLRGEGTALF